MTIYYILIQVEQAYHISPAVLAEDHLTECTGGCTQWAASRDVSKLGLYRTTKARGQDTVGAEEDSLLPKQAADQMEGMAALIRSAALSRTAAMLEVSWAWPAQLEVWSGLRRTYR